MQIRSQWQDQKDNLTVGQVVLVTSEATKPFQWPLGIVEAVHPDADGLVRVVSVRFRGKVKKSSILSLAVLLDEPPTEK